MNKGLTIKSGQTHMHRYMRPLLRKIVDGEIDPSFIITHRLPLERAPHAYDIFHGHTDNCIKVILKPHEGNGEGDSGTAKDSVNIKIRGTRERPVTPPKDRKRPRRGIERAAESN
jgi:hypothetical protein